MPSVAQHFQRELASFGGERAIFIHNAYYPGSAGFVGEVDPGLLARDAIGNAAARIPFEGRAVYAAAKAGVEQFARVLQRERTRRGCGPWVVAVRPGFIDTPSVRLEAEGDPSTYPIAGAIRSGLEAGEADSPEEAARRIWAALPPPPGETVLLFGAVPSGTRPGPGDQS